MYDIATTCGPVTSRWAILDDPEASSNDRFVALDLLKNANISAGGILPMCQDTGTAIVMAKKGERVFTGVNDEEAISRGIYETYLTDNLRYSQLAPLTMWEEKNIANNLPAQIEIYATEGDVYKFLFMAKGGGSANKSYLYQQTKALLNPQSLMTFLDEKLRTLGTSACPPYHLAVVIGGTSAEYALKVASTLGALSRHAADIGQRPRRAFVIELEQQILQLRNRSASAAVRGKYFCHDVRWCAYRATARRCPVAIPVSGSADRQALGMINADGIFLEQLEHDPAGYLPETTVDDLAEVHVVHII